MARLELLSPSRGPVVVPLGAGRVRAGRHPDAELPLESAACARIHFFVEAAAEGYLLCDAESAGGTRLNGAKIAGPVRLEDGDEIGVGADVRVRFRR